MSPINCKEINIFGVICASLIYIMNTLANYIFVRANKKYNTRALVHKVHNDCSTIIQRMQVCLCKSKT